MKAAAALLGISLPGGISETDEVEQLLAKGNSKAAVELAKAIHKRAANAESERLLVKAYAARITSMTERRLYPEAKALFEMVWEKYPASRGMLQAIRPTLSEGSLEDLLRPLNDAALPAEERARIETAIQRNVTNVAALAECSALSPDHPLRTAAAALRQAFDKVTSGPVEDAALELPEVSRRGPLAGWKTLVRAIASFYRREDETCERYLQAIPAESPCARFTPVLRSLIAGQPVPGLKPSGATLMLQVGGNTGALRTALENLDRAIENEHAKTIIEAGRAAMTACRQNAPDLAARLQQEIAARLIIADMRDDQVNKATDGPPRRDAYFWRRAARVLEATGPEALTLAGRLWDQFLKQAVHEGWFNAKGPEAAVLYLHLADLLKSIPDDFREAAISGMREADDYLPDELRSSRDDRTADYYFLYPDVLYRLACEIDPHNEAFEQWLAWAKEQSEKKRTGEVLEAWRRALPGELRPVLLLLEAAENRKSLTKALALLDEAERIDSLNPEVRRARLRLLVAGAMRHLGQKKPHLAEKELDGLEALPQAQEKDRPAFLTALRWISDVLDGDAEGPSRRYSRLAEALGSPLAASLIITGVARACEIEKAVERFMPMRVKSAASEPAAAAVARACALGDDMGVPIDIPDDMEAHIVKELSAGRGKFQVEQLRALAEAALRRRRFKLAHAATAAGLALGGDTEARFLFLRARSLQPDQTTRRSECIAAAAELARRQRDMKLLDEIVDLRHREIWNGPVDEAELKLDAAKLQEVLAFERKANSANQPGRHRAPRLCNCPECRARRTGSGGPSPFDDFDFDIEAMLDSFLEDLKAGRRPKPRPPKSRPPRPDRQGGLFDF